MKKLTEGKYLGLEVKYRKAKSNFQKAVREVIKDWLLQNGGTIAVPKDYLNDFKFTVDGDDMQFNSITMDSNEVYLVSEENDFEYAWAFAEEDNYIIDAVMNLYFNKPPMFNSSSDDENETDYGVSEYLEGDADTRTGEIFDNYYGIERD